MTLVLVTTLRSLRTRTSWGLKVGTGKVGRRMFRQKEKHVQRPSSKRDQGGIEESKASGLTAPWGTHK